MKRKREQESVKRDEIVGYIRCRIMSGEWSEGTALPPRTWFGKLFNAAPLTIQRAFQVLLDEKVLVAKERIGTRVADHLPNPARFALLLYGSPDHIVYHTEALLESGKCLAAEGYLVEPYFVLDRYPDEIMKSAVFADLQKQCYAGAFFEADGRWGTPEFWKRLESVPVSGFLTNYVSLPNMLPCRTGVSGGEILPLMLKQLKECGVRRVARIISQSNWHPEAEKDFFRSAAQYGLECPPGCHLSLPHQIAYSGQFKNVVRVLFAPDRTAMPDGLILQNESLLPDVCDVLHEFYGERAHQMVRIVSVANYPALPKVDYPVFFYGYDMLRTLKNGLDAIMNLRRGKKTELPDAVFFNNRINTQKESRVK